MAEKNVKTLEPPPLGKFVEIDANFIHIVTDDGSEGFFQAFAIAKKIEEDIRMSSYNFQIKIHPKSTVFIPEYIKATKKDLHLFENKDAVRSNFVIGDGDILIASGSTSYGSEKVLKGLQTFVNQNDEAFCCFVSTSPITDFKEEKFDFDILALNINSLTQNDSNNDNIIAINDLNVLQVDLKAENNLKKPEKDYIFLLFPHLNARRKQEIRTFKKTKTSGFGLENMLISAKTAYEQGRKIVILSNLVNEEDYETELALRILIQQSINVPDVKLKFVHHDYTRVNKISEIFYHLIANENDRIIFPSSHPSEIFSFLKGGIKPENIFWFADENKSSLLPSSFGRMDSNIFESFELFSKFREQDILLLKNYKSQVIRNEVVLTYLVEEIIKAYTEDTQSKDKQTDKHEEEVEEENEEELDGLEEELEQQPEEDEIEDEVEVEVEEVIENKLMQELEEVDVENEDGQGDFDSQDVEETEEEPEIEEEHALLLDELHDEPLDYDVDSSEIEYDESVAESHMDLEELKEQEPQKENIVSQRANENKEVSSGFER